MIFYIVKRLKNHVIIIICIPFKLISSFFIFPIYLFLNWIMFLIFVIVFNNINFVGFLSNGTQFDSSRDRNKPFRFQLGSCQVVQGLGKCKYIKGAVHSVNSKSSFIFGSDFVLFSEEEVNCDFNMKLLLFTERIQKLFMLLVYFCIHFISQCLITLTLLYYWL